jgi:hypothetical protein
MQIGSTDLYTLQFTDNGLSGSDDVQYKVRAETLAGFGEFSVRSTFTLASVPIVNDAPVLVSTSQTSITVQWSLSNDGGSPLTGYKLYQTNTTTGGESVIYDGSNIPTVSSHRIARLISGDSYQYRVTAINRVGEGPFSPFTDVIIAATVPSRPETPVFISASEQ